ncbi:MarR family winged helix-turn-helix transcriptional regulator [Dactylosporangium siamense]|uniref:MarR family transcriptional regulator n=1 Tax=Dactylosporangium siamense TaxID=685454 RepID=A0A919UEY0_9ACTN|nr:MarR family transcriptional regulator [Dactylosporangium siamense]GIG52929.1 MarR family transcriptional regulator [Dactylosporangium siamense]
MPDRDDRSWGGAAFLLAQLGAHATTAFAQRVAELDLTPPQAGLIRMLAQAPGRSQLTYAERLGMPPSRFVTLVNTMEERGLVERRRGEPDRRVYALHLTDAGQHIKRRLDSTGKAHEDDLFAALTTAERTTLRELLARIAQQQNLTAGVHPGYRQRPGRSE